MNSQPFITRVVLKNYKSIDSCNVKLGNLNFLIGQNGSGKSNSTLSHYVLRARSYVVIINTLFYKGILR